LWWGNLRERSNSEDPVIERRIILILSFRKWEVRALIGSIWLRIWTGACTCECGNELSGSIKCGEFLD
jgi:hypothetical protein